MQAFAK